MLLRSGFRLAESDSKRVSVSRSRQKKQNGRHTRDTRQHKHRNRSGYVPILLDDQKHCCPMLHCSTPKPALRRDYRAGREKVLQYGTGFFLVAAHSVEAREVQIGLIKCGRNLDARLKSSSAREKSCWRTRMMPRLLRASGNRAAIRWLSEDSRAAPPGSAARTACPCCSLTSGSSGCISARVSAILPP